MNPQDLFQQTSDTNEEGTRGYYQATSEETNKHVSNKNEELKEELHQNTPEEIQNHFINENVETNEEHQHPQTEFHMPVYAERTTITIQPRRTEDDRVPMPVSTVNWQTTNLTHFIPLSGLEFLSGADQVIIKQTVELQDLLATVESENRYIVKVPYGETLYFAAEASNSLQRLFCGSSRGFDMKLFDQTRQQAILLRRRFAFSNCLCGCYLQAMTVYTPGGEILGSVEQEWTMVPSFVVKDSQDRIEFIIEGPQYVPCTNYSGSTFRVLSRDGLTQVSTIMHEWNNLTGDFNIVITFPSQSMQPKMKAVFLGAGFLLEYVFFEKSKSGNKCQRLCNCC